jgi:hypothetical protein
MIRQAGVVHARDDRMALQELRQLERALLENNPGCRAGCVGESLADALTDGAM